MRHHPRIEATGDHHYLVTSSQQGDVVQVDLYASPSFMERLRVPSGAEVDVVITALGILLEHQTIDELPAQLDLEDVAAAYDGVEERLRARVTARET